MQGYTPTWKASQGQPRPSPAALAAVSDYPGWHNSEASRPQHVGRGGFTTGGQENEVDAPRNGGGGGGGGGPRTERKNGGKQMSGILGGDWQGGGTEHRLAPQLYELHPGVSVPVERPMHGGALAGAHSERASTRACLVAAADPPLDQLCVFGCVCATYRREHTQLAERWTRRRRRRRWRWSCDAFAGSSARGARGRRDSRRCAAPQPRPVEGVLLRRMPLLISVAPPPAEETAHTSTEVGAAVAQRRRKRSSFRFLVCPVPFVDRSVIR